MGSKRSTVKKKRTGPKKTHSRPSWDEYFLQMAELASQRATCLRRRVGAVLVKDKRILATGYNGAPSGLEHCLEKGCLRDQLKIPSGERHELCLPAGEEIWTDEGYVSIENIRIGQRVLTHKGLYRKVTKLYKREYRGIVYRVEPWNLLPVCLTPEHPVLAIRSQRCEFDTRTLCKETCRSVNRDYCSKPYRRYRLEWISASQLHEKDIVSLVFDNKSFIVDELDLSFLEDVPADYYRVLEARKAGSTYQEIKDKLNIWPSTAQNWVTGGLPRDAVAVRDNFMRQGSSLAKIIPKRLPLTTEVLRLIGFYLAEGCTSANQLSFSFHRKEEDYIREVKATMRDVFQLSCYENKVRNVHVLVYSSTILAKAFKYLFGGDAYTKQLPQVLMRLAPEKQQHILDAYAQGDGYYNRYRTAISSASKILILQVVQILLRLGRVPTVDQARNIFRVIWKDKVKIPYSFLKENVFYAPIRSIEKKDYSGSVYNLEVEGDQSYTTKSFVIHNCRGLHGEQNALIQASLHGVSVKGSTLYATTQPCIICAKMLINAGIAEIVIAGGYPDKMAMDFLKQAGIKVRRVLPKK